MSKKKLPKTKTRKSKFLLDYFKKFDKKLSSASRSIVKTKPKTKPKPKLKTRLKTKLKAKPKNDLKSKRINKSKSQSASKTKSKQSVKLKFKSNKKQSVKPKLNPKPKSNPKPKLNPKPKSKPKLKSKLKPKLKPFKFDLSKIRNKLKASLSSNNNSEKSDINSKLPVSNMSKSNFSNIKNKIQERLNNRSGDSLSFKNSTNSSGKLSKFKKGSLFRTKKFDSHTKEFILTGVPGFDDLFETGIPKGNAILLAGGAGSGKTIFSLQVLFNHARAGKKCLFMTFEESEDRLVKHMKEFGMDPSKFIKSGKLKIKKFSPFEIARSVDAMLAKEKGELLIDIDPVLLPAGFKPDIVVLDSLTAVASAFTSRVDSYRIYVEQLFRFFEKIGSTSFLITETTQIPTVFSSTGVEEFLADGVVVLYNIKRDNFRENALEVLKMRGEKHKKQIVSMKITHEGMVVYPDQEVFGGLS